MSDQPAMCPRCGANKPEDHPDFQCGSDLFNGNIRQSDRCRVAELTKQVESYKLLHKIACDQLAMWRPLTIEEAERAYEEAEAIPLSQEEVDRILAKVLDPAYRPDNVERAHLAVAKVRDLTQRLAAVERENAELRAEILAWKWSKEMREQEAKTDADLRQINMDLQAAMLKQIEQLRADMARLDWLEARQCTWYPPDFTVYFLGLVQMNLPAAKTFREAIDTAMKGSD